MVTPALIGAALSVVAFVMPTPATDTTWHTLTREGASDVRYSVIRPVGDADAPRSVLLAFPPGSQDRAMVDRSTELYWQTVAESGWIVVCPEAPDEGYFFDAGAAAIGPLLDEIEATMPGVGRVHVAGPSNGGRSAFRVAFDHAPRLASVTVLPGFPEPDDLARAQHLANLPVAMFVGGADGNWLDRMTAARDALEVAGADVATFRVFADEGHTPPSLTGAVLAAQLDLFDSRERARVEAVATIGAVLDDFHDAAAAADTERYFGHFSSDAVFLGTDATERWSPAQFRAYAEPFFSEGTGWSYTATERHVGLSADRRTAWFDERLHNDKYGETRGSGALVLIADRWYITQYNLAIPVPNDLAGDLVTRIAEHLEGGDK